MSETKADCRIDILMATYNGAEYIGEQIESILAQTYHDWHLLVSDDGSTDATVAIVEEFAAADDRVELLSPERKAQGAAQNFLSLLEASDADYYLFCDQDDVWVSDKVAVELEAMRDLESSYGSDRPLLVFTDSCIVDEGLNTMIQSCSSTKPFESSTIALGQLLIANVGQGCTMLLNRALAERITAKDMPANFLMHDYWAMAVAMSLGAVRYLPNQTVLYRQHGNNVYGAGHATATAKSGMLHLLRSPAIARGWLRRLSEDEKKFCDRAKTLLDSFEDELPLENRALLECLSEFGDMKLGEKVRTIKEEGLIKNGGRAKYELLCQFAGMMLS